MGMTAADRAKRDAEIAALVGEQTADDSNRADKQIVETEDATIGNEELLRGIPAVGRVSGTMRGSRPGIDTVAELEDTARELNEHARLILNARLKAAREKLPRRHS